MVLRRWEDLPADMQTDEVRKYYSVLEKKKASLFFKRVFDIIVSFVMLVILSPLFLILAVIIKLDSKGPVFYRQERVTQYGRKFRIHKFRTMVTGADSGAHVTSLDDERITRVGKLIRDTRIDEICQLIDVFCGNMTFVSTRAEATRYVEAYTPEMMATLLLPAGVTNETCIYFKDEAKLLCGVENADEVYIKEILPQKMVFNLKALEDFSLIHDLKVMIMTVLSVLGKEYTCEKTVGTK